MTNWKMFARVIFFTSVLNFIGAERFVNKDGLEVAYNITYNKNNVCYSDRNRFQLYNGIKVDDCVKECSLRSHCEVLQYNVQVQMCELYTAEPNTLENTGCLTVKRNDLVITKLPCSDVCQQGMSCDLDLKQCVYKECLEIPPEDYGWYLGNRNEIGSERRLQCDIGFGANQKTAVCQEDGSWSSGSQICTLFPDGSEFQCPVSDTVYTNLVFNDGTSFNFRFVSEIRLVHSQAFEYCLNENAHLIKSFPVPKRIVLLMLMRQCHNKYNSRYWIDGNNINATDFLDSSQWVISTGEPMTNDFWKPQEPNKPTTDHCAYLYLENPSLDTLICDWKCSTEYYFICEK